MRKTTKQTPVAKREKASGKRNARMAVGASLSMALFAAPLSAPAMAAELNPDGTMNIEVSTSWLGDIGKEANINLLANGIEVDETTLTPETGWVYTFKNVPAVTGENGEPVVYTVTEDNADGYDTQISGDQELGFIVSNIQANNEVLVDDGVLDGSVAVTYKNQDGDVIAYMVVSRGKTGTPYNIVPKAIPGHTLIGTEGETAGTFAAGVTKSIVFTYQLDPDYTPGDPEVEYIEGIIEARYVNQDGIEIALRETSTGEVDSVYKLNSKAIQGYTFDKVEGLAAGADVLFEEGSQVVTYVYTENEDAPEPVTGSVVTKHVNEQGEEIAERVRVSGNIDAAYKTEAQDIEGYEFVKVNGEANGTFAQGITIIEYVYKASLDAPVVDKEPVDEPKEPVVDEKPTDTPKEPVVAESKFAALYDSLEFGMSYDDAVAMMGSKGTVDAAKQGKIDGKVVAGVKVYSWTAANSESMSLGFINEKLVSKSFVGDGDTRLDYEYDELVSQPTPTPTPAPANGDVKDTPVVPVGNDAPKDRPAVNGGDDTNTPIESVATASNYKSIYDSIAYGISYKEAVEIMGTEGTAFDMDHELFADMEIPEGMEMYFWKASNGDTMVLGFTKDKLVVKGTEIDGVRSVEEASTDDVMDMLVADKKLADEKAEAKDPVKAEASETPVEGQKLADTATNTFNLMALGAGLLLAAGAGLFALNRRRQATDTE